MSSPAVDVAAYLEAEGAGTVGAAAQWGIFIGSEPATRFDAITIYDTGGSQANADGPLYENTIQVRVRAADYAAGYAKALDIRDFLLVPRSRIIGSWRYTGFWLISDVAKIGRDDDNRELFTVNFRLMRQRQPL